MQLSLLYMLGNIRSTRNTVYPFIFRMSTSSKLSSSKSSNDEATCAPCSSLDGSSRLSLDEAKAELASLTRNLSLWTLNKSNSNKEEDTVLSISRNYTAKNFQAAMDSLNDVGKIAEIEGHHPNLHLTNYREVEINIYTHKLGGLTKNDFILAEKIDDGIFVNYSPKWLREHPEAIATARKND